jgi:hypothetical protein
VSRLSQIAVELIHFALDGDVDAILATLKLSSPEELEALVGLFEYLRQQIQTNYRDKLSAGTAQE